jgi:hypothetical protein
MTSLPEVHVIETSGKEMFASPEMEVQSHACSSCQLTSITVTSHSNNTVSSAWYTHHISPDVL